MRRTRSRVLNLGLVLAMLLVYTPALQATPSLPAPAAPESPNAPTEAWELAATGVGNADFAAGNVAISAMATFGGNLYAGAQNAAGASVLESFNDRGYIYQKRRNISCDAYD